MHSNDSARPALGALTLGALGEQSVVAEQYRTLPNDLLDLYSKEYIATWRARAMWAGRRLLYMSATLIL